MVNNRNKEWVCMLLAGGQGSRLYALTRDVAKPAVSFGGKYRIIDFALSNCANSGVDTVGVLTQYRPLLLNDYIGSGQAWDLDRLHGGVHILPPYQKQQDYDWYKGTANAVYQNIHFIDKYQPEHVLVLSGDHIYKMDYAKMLKAHKRNNADCTIAVIDVPIEEASRFGIMNADESGRIYEFEEKPAKPKSTTASMGVYIFRWEVLREYLIADDQNPSSSGDFGKDVIPAMLNSGKNMFTYLFGGYWKDVGTLNSLWEANMDLLSDVNLGMENWRVYSRPTDRPPHYVGEQAKISNSIITEGCEIYGTVENSVLSSGVVVEEGAVVRDAVIMRRCKIGKNTKIEYAILDEFCVIGENATIGAPRSSGCDVALVADHVTIGDGKTVAGGEMLEEDRR